MFQFHRNRSSVVIGAVLLVAAAVAATPRLRAQQDVDIAGIRVSRSGLTREHLQAMQAGASYVPGRLIVKFAPGAEPQARSAALAAVSGAGSEKQTEFADFATLAIPVETDPRQAAAVLSAQPDVQYAEPVYLHRFHSRPNDPSYARQWNFHSIGMDVAWDINPGARSDIVVAVIDSGVAYRNDVLTMLRSDGRFLRRITVPFLAAPDLTRSDRFVSPWDFVWGDAQPFDMHGHGTHVAGTIGQSTNNGIGLAGMASNVRIMPLKVCASAWDLLFLLAGDGVGYVEPAFSSCSAAMEAAAIRYAADRGAKVINLSLGGRDASTAVREALRYAVSRGAFVAIAAGNDYDRGNPITYPAAFAPDIDGVVAVGAVSRDLTRAYYSNTGRYVEIAAPGGNLRRDGVAGGIYQQTLNDAFFDTRVISPRFDIFVEGSQQGTSMAAPHVAGLAALLYSQGVTSPAAIEAAIKRFARDLGPRGRDDEFGYGLIDPRATLRGMGVAR